MRLTKDLTEASLEAACKEIAAAKASGKPIAINPTHITVRGHPTGKPVNSAPKKRGRPLGRKDSTPRTRRTKEELEDSTDTATDAN